MEKIFKLSTRDIEFAYDMFKDMHGYSEVHENTFKKSLENYIDTLNDESLRVLNVFSDEKILMGIHASQYLDAYKEEKDRIMESVDAFLKFENKEPHSLRFLVYSHLK